MWLTIKWSSFFNDARAKLAMSALWVGSACAGACYAISLYYFPLYFAFAKGADALEQTLWVLPFVFAFIASVAVTGRLLHTAGFYIAIYPVGGVAVAATSVTLAVTLRQDTPKAQVAALEVLMGLGVGLLFQHSVGICNAIERRKDKLTRLDSVFMCNYAQMGGISVTLAVAASIFQNVGYRLVADGLGTTLSEDQIRELLAGSVTKSQDRALVQKGADIVSRVIAIEFYIVAAFGGLSLMVGVLFAICMRHEKVEFKETVWVPESASTAETTESQGGMGKFRR